MSRHNHTVHVRVTLDEGRVYQDILIRPRTVQLDEHAVDYDVIVSHAAGTRRDVAGGFADPSSPAPHEILIRRPLFSWRRGRPGIELIQSALNKVVSRDLASRFS